MSHSRRSLRQFGLWCGHGQNKFSQIVIFSSSFKNLSFAGLGPEQSQTKAKLAILEIVQLMSKASVGGCWFFEVVRNSMILCLVPHVSHSRKSLRQFWFCCGHGRNQFSQILIFSQPCQNLAFACLGPELSQTKAKLAILRIVQLMSRATVAGC